MKRLVISVAILAALAAPAEAKKRAAVIAPQQPAQITIDGYRIASPFERLKAVCEATADGSGTGVFAFGKPAFVGGAILGNAIGNAIRHARSYDQCMTIHGFVRNQ